MPNIHVENHRGAQTFETNSLASRDHVNHVVVTTGSFVPAWADDGGTRLVDTLPTGTLYWRIAGDFVHIWGSIVNYRTSEAGGEDIALTAPLPTDFTDAPAKFSGPSASLLEMDNDHGGTGVYVVSVTAADIKFTDTLVPVATQQDYTFDVVFKTN